MHTPAGECFLTGSRLRLGGVEQELRQPGGRGSVHTLESECLPTDFRSEPEVVKHRATPTGRKG